MISYAGRRLALIAPMLFGMSLLVFGLMRLVPGDPAVIVLGYKATPETVRKLRETFHLDAPLAEQYLRWLGGALRGDFGLDFRQNEPIGEMILARLPVTIELTLLASAMRGADRGAARPPRRRPAGRRRRPDLARDGPRGRVDPRLLARHHADPAALARRRPLAVQRLRPARRRTRWRTWATSRCRPSRSRPAGRRSWGG